INPYQALQGTWAGTDGSVSIILMFNGNSCGLNMNGQQTFGTWNIAGNKINMHLQTGKSVSYTYALQGNTLILGRSIRLLRQQMPQQGGQGGTWQQPQQPGGWGQPQPQQPGWGQPQQQPMAQPSPLLGRWTCASNSGNFYMVMVFTENLCIVYFNGSELERSTYTYSNGQLTQNMLSGKAAGRTLVWECQLNGNSMVITGGGLMKPVIWVRQN
ncbi:MAG: hypothetical protein J6I40_07170, partial [Mailhella sp.]|nr:hypothetical protein [Mailhella sp.]